MIQNPVFLVQLLLAAVAVIFVWFTVGELFPAATNSDQLLACAASGFGLAALILP